MSDRMVTFRLTALPENTPGDAVFYLAGDFNGWRAGAEGFCFSMNEETPTLTVDTSARDHFEFKITRGEWETVEVHSDGFCIDNRILEPCGEKLDVSLEIEAWRDLCPRPSTLTGLHETRTVAVPWSEKERTLRIYLPPDYHQGEQRYPVFYLMDGQNLFDEATAFSGEWAVDETLERLFQEGRTSGVIVVGVDNGEALRLSEYSPWPFQFGEYQGEGWGDRFGDFLVDTIKPLIDQEFRTLPDRIDTGIGGSSMGGLISLCTGLRRSDVFSKIAALSSSLQPSVTGDGALQARIETLEPSDSIRLYMDIGDSEHDDPVFQAHHETAKILRQQDRVNLRYEVIQGGTHSEHCWRDRFDDVFLWLYHRETTLSTLSRTRSR